METLEEIIRRIEAILRRVQEIKHGIGAAQDSIQNLNSNLLTQEAKLDDELGNLRDYLRRGKS